jgi:hypothetical protein
VDGAKLVQPHGVVDDHDLGRHLRHPSAGLVDLGPQRGLVDVPARPSSV